MAPGMAMHPPQRRQFPLLGVEFCTQRRLSTVHSSYGSASSHEVNVVDSVLVDNNECHFLEDAVTFNISSDSRLWYTTQVTMLGWDFCPSTGPHIAVNSTPCWVRFCVHCHVFMEPCTAEEEISLEEISTADSSTSSAFLLQVYSRLCGVDHCFTIHKRIFIETVLHKFSDSHALSKIFSKKVAGNLFAPLRWY